MALIMICILVLVAGSLITLYDDIPGSIIIIFAGVAILVIAITIPAMRHATVNVLAEASTLQDVLQSNSDLVIPATKYKAQERIIQINESLRRAKMYNKGLLDIWIPDEVDTAELIKIP